MKVNSVLKYDDEWPNHPNTLGQDDGGNFHLFYTSEGPHAATFEIEDGHEPSTIEDVLQWYILAEKFSTQSFHGNLTQVAETILAYRGLEKPGQVGKTRKNFAHS